MRGGAVRGAGGPSPRAGAQPSNYHFKQQEEAKRQREREAVAKAERE